MLLGEKFDTFLNKSSFLRLAYREGVMTKYTEADAARDTGASAKNTEDAWHASRDEVRDTGFRDPQGLDNQEWRDRADRELRGIVEDVTTGSYDDDYGGDQGSGGGGGICYIATATLMGRPESASVLRLLKGWRYGTLEQSRLGLKLSNYYRRTAPSLAQILPRYPVVAGSIRGFFVLPAVRMLKREPKTKVAKLFRDLVLGLIFVSGLVYGGILRRVVK